MIYCVLFRKVFMQHEVDHHCICQENIADIFAVRKITLIDMEIGKNAISARLVSRSLSFKITNRQMFKTLLSSIVNFINIVYIYIFINIMYHCNNITQNNLANKNSIQLKQQIFYHGSIVLSHGILLTKRCRDPLNMSAAEGMCQLCDCTVSGYLSLRAGTAVYQQII